MEATLKQTFPHADQAELLRLLEMVPGDNEVSRSRVQLAVLALSDGDPQKLRHYIRVAEADWRDVLYWAEYPPEIDRPCGTS
ncbi:MAG TPA: hypothetical protein VGW38_29015 [Chloroflexota bacterium]|nr:hypothetical protein [Chloroflexota bacterium]